jgi:hypothetical protein
MKYKATLGTASTLITLFVSVLLGAILVFFWYTAMETGKTVMIIASGGITIGLVDMYRLTYLSRPVS